MFLDYVSSIESDDGKSSIWSNDTVSYVSTTQPSSLESNIELAESVFSSLVLADNPWDRRPLPPIQMVEDDSENSVFKVIIINGVERVLSIASDTKSEYQSQTSRTNKRKEQRNNEDGQIMTRRDSGECSPSLKSLHIESKAASPTPSRESNHESNGDSPFPLDQILRKYDEKRTELQDMAVNEDTRDVTHQGITNQIDREFLRSAKSYQSEESGIDVSRSISADIIEYYLSEASSPTLKETKQIPDIQGNNSEHEITSRRKSQPSKSPDLAHNQDTHKLFHSPTLTNTFTEITNQVQEKKPGDTGNKKQDIVFPTSDDDIHLNPNADDMTHNIQDHDMVKQITSPTSYDVAPASLVTSINSDSDVACIEIVDQLHMAKENSSLTLDVVQESIKARNTSEREQNDRSKSIPSQDETDHQYVNDSPNHFIPNTGSLAADDIAQQSIDPTGNEVIDKIISQSSTNEELKKRADLNSSNVVMDKTDDLNPNFEIIEKIEYPNMTDVIMEIKEDQREINKVIGETEDQIQTNLGMEEIDDQINILTEEIEDQNTTNELTGQQLTNEGTENSIEHSSTNEVVKIIKEQSPTNKTIRDIEDWNSTNETTESIEDQSPTNEIMDKVEDLNSTNEAIEIIKYQCQTDKETEKIDNQSATNELTENIDDQSPTNELKENKEDQSPTNEVMENVSD